MNNSVLIIAQHAATKIIKADVQADDVLRSTKLDKT